jgi:adenine-specific DNA methylase
MKNSISQIDLFGKELRLIKLPSTRYQGSKYKIVKWIWEKIEKFSFNKFLDAFGGTGVVAYYMKRMGKEVHYNDYLKFNYYIGLALIENNSVILSEEKVKSIIEKSTNMIYKNFIFNTFKDIYYSDDENEWLDIVIQNIESLQDIYEKYLAYYALFQSSLVKRPFNLFHRKNLYIRNADVKRSFGNKRTWDTPFEVHFLNFVNEINNLIFNNNRNNKSFNLDVFELSENYDLVYIDPPYTSQKGVTVDYLDFYHFLEGIVNYEVWDNMIDYRTKHKRLKRIYNPWNDPKKIKNIFREVIYKFKDSIICISYRSDGIPSIEEIKSFVKEYKRNIDVYYFNKYRYVLSNDDTQEVLIIGW